MKSWSRIILTAFVLIGGAALFGYWSLGQFENAFDNLGSTIVASISSVSSSPKTDVQLASTSPERLGPVTTSTDLELFFTFPQKGDEVYISCTYPISWQSSSTITSLEMALIDAGTREPAGPIASGIAKENIIEKNSQNLIWKVGVVWPGEYYILISKINGQEIVERSGTFMINKIPEGENRENFCTHNDI